MSLAMTPAEREAFLAEVHVAVVTVADGNDRGPLAIPLWYEYQPGGEIFLVTDRDSRKARLIRSVGRVTVCAQSEEMPYRYISVEGPVTAIEDTVTVEQRWELARRYLGRDGADRYIDATPGATERMCAIHIRPERWLTRDYTKAGGEGSDPVRRQSRTRILQSGIRRYVVVQQVTAAPVDHMDRCASHCGRAIEGGRTGVVERPNASLFGFSPRGNPAERTSILRKCRPWLLSGGSLFG